MLKAFLSYFQIFCLGLFLALLAWKTLYLYRNYHINAITLTFKHKGFQSFLEFSLIIVTAIWMLTIFHESLPDRFHIFQLPLKIILFDSVISDLAGFVLIVSGFILDIMALNTMNKSWRIGIDKNHPGKLVTAGIFSVIRNPIYLFLNLYFAGTFLINGTLLFLIFALFIGTNLHLQICEEEKFLEAKFGENYRKYRANTSRYLPFKIPAKRFSEADAGDEIAGE